MAATQFKESQVSKLIGGWAQNNTSRQEEDEVQSAIASSVDEDGAPLVTVVEQFSPRRARPGVISQAHSFVPTQRGSEIRVQRNLTETLLSSGSLPIIVAADPPTIAAQATHNDYRTPT